jgi:uncharacterized membrane protein YbaN (DUF454 family)
MTQLSAGSVSFGSGRLSVTDRRVLHPGRPHLAAALLSELAALDDIAAADLDLDLGTCVVRWHDTGTTASQAASAFVRALSAARATEAAGAAPPIVHGARRLLFLAAGGGCLVMTVVGAILPGVPTVPFLLASSYYLARSSRRLHAGLVATPVFGGVVREWESHHAISRASKLKIAGLTLAVVATTATVSRATPSVMAILVVVVSTTMYGIFRMPEIERPSGSRRLGGRLAAQKLVNLVASRA